MTIVLAPLLAGSDEDPSDGGAAPASRVRSFTPHISYVPQHRGEPEPAAPNPFGYGDDVSW